MVGLVKAAMRKTNGNASLAFNELKEVILDVEVALNGRKRRFAATHIDTKFIDAHQTKRTTGTAAAP